MLNLREISRLSLQQPTNLQLEVMLLVVVCAWLMQISMMRIAILT